MPNVTTFQAAHTYGVLAPLTIERRDTKFVAGSLSAGERIVMLPQGGYADAGGTTDFGRARRALTEEPITAGMLTLPNGGTAANLLDDNTDIVTSAAAGARFVLAEIDFGAVKTIHFLDITGVMMATAGAPAALIAEYWTGAAWQAFGAALKIDTVARGRRFASGAPGDGGISAQKFRFAVDATTGASGAVTVRDIGAWTESGAKTDAIVRDFTGEDGSATELVFSAGNCDIFKNGAWQAAADWPVTEAQLRIVKPEQRYDTLLGFHRDVQTLKLVRMGGDGEWSLERVSFENVPLADYGGIYTNGVNEIQQVTLYTIAGSEQFDLTLEGQTTVAITRDAADSVTATAIKTALEDLSGVDAGLTVTAIGGNTFQIEFTGGDNAERDWLIMAGTALNANGFVRVRTKQEGKAPGEPVISASAGWPAVGRFVGQRLVMGGLRKRPNDIIASVQGSPFDLNTEIDIATAAFSYEVEFPQNNEIRDIAPASLLVIIGDKQVAFLRDDTLSATEAPKFGFSDSPGIKAGVPLTSSDNALFYVQDGGTTLRLLNYTALEENYVSDNASILSSHLIIAPVDMNRRRAAGYVNADLLMIVNGDGSITVLTMMRTQEVSGFAPWHTDGLFKSLTVSRSNEVWLTAERTVDGAAEIRLERYDAAGYLDEALEQTVAPASATISGLSRFNGRQVWLQNAGSFFGPYTVAGGAVECDRALEGTVIAGSWTPPSATDPKILLEAETGQREARLKRVCRAVISVLDTTSLAIAANGAAAVDIPLHSNDSVTTDTGPLDQPVTGRIEAEGMHGFTEDGTLTVTQLHPGRLLVRAVQKDVAA
ncbi:hypothetical protein [Oricola cellulosilytica]|uniref:Uncharacterized protein n=1 Tax=Oricola cellulosilytica TaxID=1429082 RepID=A0A4R0PFG2_9HYPH|nr:hypothetical protein [Oricola cellulosilytica]TCD15145.1 hypothetical protein E0D97_06245 [Oricola cellulosilytica]